MFQLIGSLKDFFKPSSCVVDDFVFRLHYKVTAIILFGCSILVTLTQHFGDAIECHHDTKIQQKFLNNFCWIHTTFTAPKDDKDKYPEYIPGFNYAKSDSQKIYHAYYQWVSLALFFQGLLFFLPRFIWRSTGGGLYKNLIQNLNLPIASQDTKTANRALLMEYLFRSSGTHDKHLITYVTTEVLNFVNVVLQMVFMNRFFGGQFTKFGFKVLNISEYNSAERNDPMIRVFPRLAKCMFRDYGSSGTDQIYYAICLLPINIINEKIYVFLWFWFYFLAVVSGTALVFRFVTIIVPKVRQLSIESRCLCLSSRENLKSVLKQWKTSDWFVLNIISKNLDPLNFDDLVKDLYKTIEEKCFTNENQF